MQFINDAEKRVAEVLTSLRVAWLYEPTLFVLATDEHGNCTYGFRPDFYLPRHDLYLEVTEMKVLTPKNGKLRRMKELYPEVRCVLLTKTHVRSSDLREQLLNVLRATPLLT